jgi:hypothetical protein
MDSPTFLNNDLIRALYDATFGGVLPTFPGGTASYPLKNNRIGDVLNYAKSYLPVINVGNEQGVIYEWQIFHVIGDPTLEMWKALPKVVTMKARLIKTTLDVLLSTCPFGTVMTIWLYTGGLRSSSRMLKRIEPLSTHITIPLAGLVLIPMLPIVPRPYLTICLYAPEHRFTAVRVNIPLVKPPIP